MVVLKAIEKMTQKPDKKTDSAGYAARLTIKEISHEAD
jgi:hypothetical protein